MPRTRIIQNNFTAGEFSPRLSARVDFAKYNNAVQTLENFLVLPHGGITRRPGTMFVAEVKDSSKKVRLIPFEFSVEQAYVIELGHLYMRFYTLSGRLEDPPGTPVEVTTPYTESEIFDIQYAQSADVLYLTHKDHAPRKLGRTSATSFTLSTITFIDGPYLPEVTDPPTITPNGTTGSITLTASAVLFDTSNGHDNSLWRIKHTTDYGYVRIDSVSSSTVANATVLKDLDGSGSVAAAYREGAWSGKRGYPGAVTFFEGRLYWAGTSNNPQTFWGSKVDDFENHTPDANDDDAVAFTIASNKVNTILWIAPSRSLVLGTAGGEFQARGGAETPITPTNILVKGETTHGSNGIRPVKVGNVVLFVQRAKRKLREFVYSFDQDSFTAPDLTLLAEHVTEGGVVDMAYEEELDSIVWLVRNDGVLLSMTYLREHEVVAWARHITTGNFESVAVIPHPDGDRDQTWLLINRTIDGGTKRYVEFLNTKDGYYDSLGVDSGLVYSGAATGTLSGLDHLEGEEVAILGNGANYPSKTVSSGQITGLDPEVTSAEVGLLSASEVKTLTPEVPLDQTIQGLPLANAPITVRLYESMGVKINNDQIYFRKPSDLMDTAVPLFSDDYEASKLGIDKKAEVTIRQELPMPCTILAIVRTLQIGQA